MTGNAQRKRILIAAGGLLTLTAIGTVMGVTAMNARQRPPFLNLSVQYDVVAPAILHMTLNGEEILHYDDRGRVQDGPIRYRDGKGDALDVEIAWYDLLQKQAYKASFSVPASRLTTMGAKGRDADLSVTTGPGADLTVTTANPEEWRLIGTGQGADLAGRPPARPVVLSELCGTPLPAGDATAAALAAAVDPGSQQQQMAMQARSYHLSKNPMPKPRCPTP